MKKENFITECLNSVKIFENLKNELLNNNNFQYQISKLIKKINHNNYRIETHNDVTNVRTLHKQNKCIKTIVSFWEKTIKKDMLIIYKDDTIMYKNEYYDKDYSIDDIIEAIELQQTNCYGTTI
jgi:signal peptidase I